MKIYEYECKKCGKRTISNLSPDVMAEMAVKAKEQHAEKIPNLCQGGRGKYHPGKRQRKTRCGGLLRLVAELATKAQPKKSGSIAADKVKG